MKSTDPGYTDTDAINAALVAEIPPERISRYVPRIKRLERERGSLTNYFFEMASRLENGELEKIFAEAEQKFLADNPEPDHGNVAGWLEWHEKSNQMLEALRAQHPDVGILRDKIADMAEPTN